MKDVLALFRLARQEKRLLILSLVCSSLVAFFTYLFVNLIQPIMDKLFQLNPGQAGPQKAPLMDDLFSHLIHQSNSFFDRMPTGDLMSRLTNDVDKIHQAISGSMADFIEELFILFALLVGVFVIDVRLAVVSFVITPLAVIPLALFSRQLKKKSTGGQGN